MEKGKNKSYLCMVVCAAVLLLLTGCNETDTLQMETGSGTKQVESTTMETEQSEVYVYVCGAVKSPGVYQLKSGARVYEAIAAAGGMTGDAVEGQVNLAEVVTDAQQIYVPDASEMEASASGTASQGTAEVSDGLVNINTADATQLMTLPGIGEAKAAAIIAYREENGPFAAPEDIMNVSGIKQGSYEKFKSLIKT